MFSRTVAVSRVKAHPGIILKLSRLRVPTKTMAGKQIGAEGGVPENLAGMTKSQLYDIMSQMKVVFSLLVDYRLQHFLESCFVID